MNDKIQIKPKILAFYLPQFHPIPENDKWWGKGFTEWTNVGKARPLFPGHYQPRVPADLGYYDLRVPETREAQAKMAKENGIDGFCYWHYWFEPGKELLERPFKEVLDLGKPDFPFCLAWANENWYHKLWDKNGTDELLIEQKYLGKEDYIKHFYSLLKAFKDERYIKQDGKPVFMIYKPLASPEIKVFMETWQELAKKEGFPGIYFIAHLINTKNNIEKCKELGFANINFFNITNTDKKTKVFVKIFIRKILKCFIHIPAIVPYKNKISFSFDKINKDEFVCPTIFTGWDNTPRAGLKGSVYIDYTPEALYEHTKYVLKNTKAPFVFVKSWNEWAEGNYLEPDLKNGYKYLNALKNAIKEVFDS